jgi:hypothetical protein
MTYPSHTVAPSIYTDFINGVKFDICEVDSSCYDLLNNKKYRYFVCVEDNFIAGFDGAEKFYNATKQERWGLFCKTMQDCKDYIDGFSSDYDKIEKLLKRVERNPVFTRSCMATVNSIRTNMMERYGVHPL